MTSHDDDVILMKSQCSKSSLLETRMRINNQCGFFKHTLKKNIVLKHECIRITTAREEAFRATALPLKFGTFHDKNSPFGK